MSSGVRTSATVETVGSSALESTPQPGPLPPQKNNTAIRNARLPDAPALATLMCELGYQTTIAEMRRRLKTMLTDAAYSTLVAEIDGVVSGMIGTLTHASHEHDDASGKIIAFVVSEKHRRNGIGHALVAAAEKDFVKRKVTRVSLTTRFSREEAHQFYEALGYSKTGFRFAKKLHKHAARRQTSR